MKWVALIGVAGVVAIFVAAKYRTRPSGATGPRATPERVIVQAPADPSGRSPMSRGVDETAPIRKKNNPGSRVSYLENLTTAAGSNRNLNALSPYTNTFRIPGFR